MFSDSDFKVEMMEEMSDEDSIFLEVESSVFNPLNDSYKSTRSFCSINTAEGDVISNSLQFRSYTATIHNVADPNLNSNLSNALMFQFRILNGDWYIL